MVLKELSDRLPDSHRKKYRPPFLFTLKTKCRNYGISYKEICDTNFNDLLADIVECDIQSLKDYFKSKQKELDANRGVNVIDANENQVANMHKRK
jgi:hypothetical protein